MNIKYDFYSEQYFYSTLQNGEEDKLSFLLTNNKGDYLHMGAKKNSCKFDGLTMCDTKTLEMFKILDEIILENVELKEVTYNGYKVTRTFKSKYTQNCHVVVDSADTKDSMFGETGELRYSDDGRLEEVVEQKSQREARDSFYLGPTGGIVYEVTNYEGKIFLDFDCKKLNDFDEWGRDYRVYKKDGIVFIEYTKKKGEEEEYKVFVGVKAMNFLYDDITILRILRDLTVRNSSVNTVRSRKICIASYM